MIRPREEVIAAFQLSDPGDKIDVPPDCCDHCAETRELARYSVERWEKIKASIRDLERRENLIRASHDVYAIRLAQLVRREEAIELRGRVCGAMALAVAALELWLHWG